MLSIVPIGTAGGHSRTGHSFSTADPLQFLREEVIHPLGTVRIDGTLSLDRGRGELLQPGNGLNF